MVDSVESFLWNGIILLDFQIFRNIPDESCRLKRKTSWLVDVCFFKSLIILVGILFGPIVFWLFMVFLWLKILEIPLHSVGEMKI